MSIKNTYRIEAVLQDVASNGKPWQRKDAAEALEELKFVRETAKSVLKRHPDIHADLAAELHSITGDET